jgi:archaellum component FlaC
MVNTLQEWWPIITAIVLYVIWIIRLENKIVVTNKVLESHQKSCIERHKVENDQAQKNNEDMKKAINSLFEITRDLSNCIHEFKGVIDGIKK